VDLADPRIGRERWQRVGAVVSRDLVTYTTATPTPFLESFEDTVSREPGPTMQHQHPDHSIFFEYLVSDTMRATGVSFGAARAAVVLAARALKGDPAACDAIRAMPPGSQAKQAVCFAYCKLTPQGGGSSSRAAGGYYRTGDLFGDIGNVVAHPDKAIAQVSHDVAHFVDQAVKHPADTLTKAFADFANMPVHMLGNVPIPGLKSLTDTIENMSPTTSLARMANAGLHGDVNGLVKLVREQVHQFQAVATMVPGIGTGVSTAIGLGEALLDGANPLEVALRAAYSAIPIPPGIRKVTDMVFDAVMALLHGQSLTDVGLTIARDRIPEGVPRDVFDTLVQIIVRHKPIAKAAEDLAIHEATKAASGAAEAVAKNLSKLAPDVVSKLGGLPDLGTKFPPIPAALQGVSGFLSRMPPSVKQQAAAQLAPIVKATSDAIAAHHAATHPAVLAQRQRRIQLRLPPPGVTHSTPARLAVAPDILSQLGARAHLPYDLHLPI
jgi:hypothetical protein